MSACMRKRSRHEHLNCKRRFGRPFRSQLSIVAISLIAQESSAFLIPAPVTRSSVTSLITRFEKNTNEEDQQKKGKGSPKGKGKSNLEKDIAKKLSRSKDRAISALSQPKEPNANANAKSSTEDATTTNAQTKKSDKRMARQKQQPQNKRFQDVTKRSNWEREKSLVPGQSASQNGKSGRDGPDKSESSNNNSNKRTNRNPYRKPDQKGTSSKASLLPPPLSNLSDDDLTSGLSSWEEFLGQTNAPIQDDERKASPQLPTISDLFPPNLATAPEITTPAAEEPPAQKKNIKGMDGVLPVSELFYRSSQSLTEEAPVGNADDEELPFSAEQTDSLTTDGNVQVRRNQAKRRRSRKMVRRGMEMLVGGVPINVDPPQRNVELHYQFDNPDWAQAISLNSRDFGPLVHQTAKDVTAIERGLYCESFVHNAMKWDVCPKDLREIVKNHHVKQRPSSYADLLDGVNAATAAAASDNDDGDEWEGDKSDGEDAAAREFLEHSDTPFLFRFSIEGVSKQELETVTDPESLARVILKAIILIAKDKLLAPDFVLETNRLTLDESEDEITTHVSLEFHFEAEGEEEDMMPIAQSIKPTMIKALRDGTFAEAIAEVATEESGWYEEVIDQISDEWLFIPNEEDDAADEAKVKDEQPIAPEPSSTARDSDGDGPFGAEARDADDLFLGGGNGGVFFDYSAANAPNAPFQGALGPLLLDAAVERAKQRYPRVIAIGDVHGCIDELQDLLRLCDYQPGDLVCFLGDLVCKGPDSISVVQMAREIGAIGVRGNHDFEVVRWYQAIQSGVDPPVVGSEHFHIASCLNKSDMKWLYSLPWYISSKDLGALFVHAGLVAGIRLAKQNPRLMMNMRSILPDGTVTSKFFSNWPWARLWDGPQTVLFGHDADRGLQQYEHAIGLDTGCVYGGRLTACILPEKRLVSVSARREYFKYRRRHYD